MQPGGLVTSKKVTPHSVIKIMKTHCPLRWLQGVECRIRIPIIFFHTQNKKLVKVYAHTLMLLLGIM